MSTTTPLQPGRYYHIYNRGNNREDLFREGRNYRFFLARYAQHVTPVADTLAYCLLRNHFHLLVRIRPEADWPDPLPPWRRFAHLFNSYAKAINRAHGRTGSLFQKGFQRIEVSSEPQLLRLVCYIHQNPEHHGFVDDHRRYFHSSYAPLLDGGTTWLQRAEVMRIFGGRADFLARHREPVESTLPSAPRPTRPLAPPHAHV